MNERINYNTSVYQNKPLKGLGSAGGSLTKDNIVSILVFAGLLAVVIINNKGGVWRWKD